MRDYYKRVFGVLWKDFKAATGEQVIGALIVIAILGFQIHYGLVKPTDVKANTWSITWPYALLVLGFFVFHLVRAPKKLDDERDTAGKLVEGTLTRRIEGLNGELQIERARAIQPDVALVWDWTDEEKPHRSLTGQTEKHILIHNRSDRHIYNVQVETISLPCEMKFHLINEIGPQLKEKALGFWDGRSTFGTNYIYFFSRPENEQGALNNGWVYEKDRPTGFSKSFLKMPMALTYEASNAKWRCEFEFIYDAGDDSMFLKGESKRLS